MERDRAMLIIEQHQPAPLWRLFHIRRCATCRRRWPCPRYHDARTSLLNHDRADVAALAPATEQPLVIAMKPPTNGQHWPLRGLVHCGYCEQPMYAAQRPGGPRTYKCGPPCERSQLDARALEVMAYCTALTALPSLATVTDDVTRAALFVETYQRVVVHGDQRDVRFIGYPS